MLAQHLHGSWQKTNVEITVVEKSREILPHGQNVDIQGSAVYVIRKMGLEEEIRKSNTTETGSRLVNSNGKSVASFPVQKGAAASMTSEFEILRGDLAKILYTATKDQPNVNYLFDTTIKEVVSNDDDSVKVELSNGDIQTFDLLVAADGQWSKVRKQCFPPESILARNMGMYAIYYTVPRIPSDKNMWNIHVALKSRIVATRPDPYGTMRAMLTLMPCDEAQATAWREASRKDRKTQRELVRRDFADAGWEAPRLLAAMDQAPDIYFHDITQIKMAKWSNSRVVCLGDTAYAPTPLTGMGTSLAIVGAYVLAGELSELKDGEHPSRALEAYETKFRPFVEETQQIPWFVPGFMHPRTALKRFTLHVLFKVIATLVSIPWLVKMFGDPTNTEDFKLPKYPKFSHEDSELSKSAKSE